MQSLCQSFRRFYATIPGPALVAREASTPRAVRLRRARAGYKLKKSDFTPTETARYERLLQKGELGRPGKEISPSQWIKTLNERRSRLRGVRTRQSGKGKKLTEVVGQKIYLPNIIFRLVRNQTPPGKPYNPFEATFRVPLSITKTDIRSYLLSVYGVKTTYIRTDVYRSPLYRTATGAYKTKSFKTFKRAVVGLVDPFYYPLRIEDMEPKERADREKWIEEKFGIEQTEWQQKYELLRLTRSDSRQSPGWKWRGPLISNRAQILKLVAERRAKREGLITSRVNEWREKRASGEEIIIPKTFKPSTTEAQA
ncbi:hypothetical protein ONZ45_g2858 [Pleurotus djamor]|nr:hypothetical protein ONZ45_g2858 [Pleurotus djamor]